MRKKSKPEKCDNVCLLTVVNSSSNRSNLSEDVVLVADEECCESDSSGDMVLGRGERSSEEDEEEEDEDGEGAQFLHLPSLRLLAQLLRGRSR